MKVNKKSTLVAPPLVELDAYCQKYLIDWESKSTVRTQKRSRFSKSSLAEMSYPFALKNYVDHINVEKLSRKKLQPFYLQSFCDMIGGVAVVEVDSITALCGKLANQDLGIELSDSIRQVAIAIGTDEMYHAFVARELLSDLKTLSGIVPTDFTKRQAAAIKLRDMRKIPDLKSNKKQKVFMAPLDYIKSDMPPKLHNIAETTMLCIFENILVDDFISIAKHANTTNPADIYVREHLTDESRHKIFFQQLMKYIWANITEKGRIALGRAITGYFVEYFTPNADQLATYHYLQLELLGLSDQDCQKIAYAVAEQECSKPLYQQDWLKSPMRLMDIAGVTAHVPTRRLLMKNHLLA